jgi:mannose/cellobiose epimerase-like protein (N-acyl-D-glucosamine 2-epimerase family)
MTQIPFAEVRTWLFDAALPFWAAHGIDARFGGFLEEIGPDGRETDAPFKRVRVTSRHTYVFSHAALLGWAPGAALSTRGYDFLLTKAQVGEGQWARLLSRQNEITDAAPDLYEFAFALYAFAWRHRLTRDAEPLAHAHQTLDFILARMRAEDGAFWPKLPAAAPLLQNPHMHFTEACLALFEASGDERFLVQAGDLVALLRRRFFDGRTLGERFNTDWSRADAPFEPGHHFEWAWILAQYQRLSGERLEAETAALVDFAERCVDPVHGFVFDVVDAKAAPLRRGSRTWPNTERIKGWLALYELTGRDPRPAVAASVRLLLERYALPNGAWVDSLDGAGQALAGPSPGSTFYHLFLAFAELLRLEPILAARAPKAADA